MKVIRGFHNIQPTHRGAWLTIGNFDGLHLGHHAIVNTLKTHAAKDHAPTMVINFHPSPDSYFHAEQAKAKLMSLREKIQLLQAWGVDYLWLLPFNARLAQLTATQFVEDILISQLGMRGIVVGDDFHFGFKRQGTVTLLQDHAKAGSYQCITLTEQQDNLAEAKHLSPESNHTTSSQRISSTRIRQALAESQFAFAAQLLGRPFGLEGRVRPGQKRGRLLGFPTANIPLGRRVSPLLGVFAGWVTILDDDNDMLLPAVANIGRRPTIGGTKEPLLEVHLIDFQGDLYGKRLRFTPISKLRDEQKFESLEALQKQLHADVASAQQLLLQKAAATL